MVTLYNNTKFPTTLFNHHLWKDFSAPKVYSYERVSRIYDFRVGPVIVLALLRQLVVAPGVFELEQRLPRRHVLVVTLLPLGVDDVCQV